MKFLSPRRQRGITFIEILLVSTIVAAAAVSVFIFAQKTSVSASVQVEQHQIENIVKTVDSLFALQPNFENLGTNGAGYLKQRAASSGLRFMTSADGNTEIATGLGGGRGTLSISAASVPGTSGPAIPNNGYRLAYSTLATDECIRLVTASYPLTHRIAVGQGATDTSATLVSTRGQMTTPPDVLAQSCSVSDPSVFLYFMPSRAIGLLSPGPTQPLPSCAPTQETQLTACPTGQVGTITQKRDGVCSGPANTIVYTAWSTTENTCQDEATAPPDSAPDVIPNDCSPIDATRVLACPAGRVGQTIQQRQINTCSGVATPWTTSSTSCQASPPPATCIPSAQTQVVACPAGQGGQIVSQRSSVCSSSTAAPSWPAWSSSHITSNTCTTSCSAGGSSCCKPVRQTQPGPVCPAGTYGAAGVQERFLGCVNASTQSGAWSTWQNFVSDSCTACPATTNETQSQWVNRTGSCAAGETGTLTYQSEQIRYRSVSYNCPSGTNALPSPAIAAWGAWTDSGATRNENNTCKPVVGRLNGCVGRDNIVPRQFNLAQVNSPTPQIPQPVRSCTAANKGQQSYQVMTNKNYPAHSYTDVAVDSNLSKTCGAFAVWLCDGSSWIQTSWRVENASAGIYTNSCPDGSKAGGWALPGVCLC